MAAKKKAKAKAKATATKSAKRPAAKNAVKKAKPSVQQKPAAKSKPIAAKKPAAPVGERSESNRPKLVSVPMPPIGALIANGMGLQYSMADYDVNDPYTFTIRDAGPGLSVHFQMGNSDEGDLVFTPEAIKSATKWAVIAQGGALLPDGEQATAIRTAVPPFLVSRAVFLALRSGGATIHSEWGAGELELQAVPAKRTIKLGARTVEVPILRATGDDITLDILDDETWPLVIEHTEAGGDNFWKLHKIGKGLGPWSGDEDEDDGESADGGDSDE